MDNKHWFFLLGLYSIPFLIYLFLRPDIVGFDSYYFLWLWKIMPEQFWLVKILQWFLGLVFLIGILKLARHFKANEFFTGLAAIALTPILFIQFSMIENDQFGFVLLPWVFYYAFQKDWKNTCIAFALICFAGFFWHGAVYWLIPLVFLSAIWLIPLVMAFILFGFTIITTVLPIGIIESEYLIGAVFLGGTLIGLFYRKEKELFFVALFFFLLAIVNSKFVLLALPFLAISTALFLQEWYAKMPRWQDLIKKTSYIMPIYLLVMFGTMLLFYPPTPIDKEIVTKFISFDSTKSDWSYCHWIRYYSQGRIEPEYCFGGNWNYDYNNSIALTTKKLDCQVLFDNNSPAKIFNCLTAKNNFSNSLQLPLNNFLGDANNIMALKYKSNLEQ